MLESVGSGLGQPGSTSRSYPAVEPEMVNLSLQSPRDGGGTHSVGLFSRLKVIIHVNFLVPRLPLHNT